MTNHDVHTITVDHGKRVVEVKIPVPLSRKDKERLKEIFASLVELAIEPTEEV